METADGGTHENQVQANAFLQFAQGQCLQQYIEEPTRKHNISMSFSLIMTNSPDKIIIITETSMSDHNIIQIETNIKIVEKKQKHQIKRSNMSYGDLNFFNENISWASIDADLLNTSSDMLLTDEKLMKFIRLLSIFGWKFAKRHVLPQKNKRKHQIPRDRRALMRTR